MARKVLIECSNADERAALATMLGGEYDVLEAENGGEAITILRRRNRTLSAMVVDLGMSAESGFDLLRAIHENLLWSQIPVIVLADSAGEEEQTRAFDLGVHNYVTKPYNQALILTLLKNCIRLRETASIVNTMRRDPLTGAFNRAAFFEEAANMIKRHEAGYYTLACFDIDSFKVINDQYGTEMGDRVLKHVASCATEYALSIDGICCRVAADKFAILYPSAFRDAEHFWQHYEEACAPPCISKRIRIRVGRYLVDDLSLLVSGMYDRASMAEQSIKGRYDVFIAQYDATMREQLLNEQQIVGEMYDALRNGHFVPWFQPQYNSATGALIGAEALIRWQHPGEDAIRQPDSFIPIFERNGFIYELDKYVWEQTCIALRRLLDEGRDPLPISVNISRYDIYHEDFFSVITGLIKRYEVPLALLLLEVTESAFAESAERIVTTINRLIAFGFTVAIDDFGSGFSSLNTLKDVPAQMLKLDMKFLEDTADARRGGNILESVVRMARWLGMSVIAEGVETQAQADYLRSIGCSYVQGYLFARPMPLEEYVALLEKSGRERKLVRLETIDTLDNNAFWDPSSMDTLIFNSYVGGACIFEYRAGRTELLRVSNRYAEELGAEAADGGAITDLSPERLLDEKNYAVLTANVETAIETGKESCCELYWDYNGVPRYYRATMRMIAKAADRYLMYCVLNNITAQRLAERNEHTIYERLQAITHHVDCGITTAVIHEDGEIELVFVNNRFYELLGYTQAQYKTEVQDTFSLMLPAYRARLFPVISGMQSLGQSDTFDMPVTRRDGSVIWLRVVISVIGLSDISTPLQLACYTDITATREKDEELEYLNDTLLNLMNKTPGGFVQMRVLPDGRIVAEYCNDGFLELVGMDREEVRAVFRDDVLKGVHPDDIGVVREIVAKTMSLGEAHNVRCRLRHGKDGYIWTLVTGQMTRDSSGEVVFNAYYMDATEQVKNEEKQKELLDNLPCGAALYEYDGKKLSIVHMNKRYWTLVDRPADITDADSVLDAVYADDREVIFRELEAAIRQKRIADCNIRIRYGKEGYRPFRMTGTVLPRGDGRYAVYSTVTPVSDESVSYQQMLPLLLSSIMSSTTDMSFAKDTEYRYLCASRAFARMAGLDNEFEIVGKTDYDLFEKPLADKFRRDDEEMLANGKSFVEMVEQIPSVGGVAHYASTSKYVLRDGSGRVIGVYGLGRDITEARTMRSQLELLTNNLPGGIAVYEAVLDTPERIRPIYFSDRFCRLFGYAREAYQKLTETNPLCFVEPEDRPIVEAQIEEMLSHSTPIDCVFRACARGGGMKWISLKGVLGVPNGERTTANVMVTDVTAHQEALERMRMSEEEYRLAIQHSACIIAHYTVADRTASLLPEVAAAYNIPEKVYDVPYGPVQEGLIAPECSGVYIAMYEEILHGSASGTAIYKERYGEDGWRWMKASYSTIFADSGEPISAVISYFDVTEQQEKEAIYRKWEQSLTGRPPESYTLYRYNLTKETMRGAAEGSLLHVQFSEGAYSFDQRTEDYVRQHVYAEDQGSYAAFLNAGRLLAAFSHGQNACSLEYRERVEGGDPRWLRLSVELVEVPNSTEVEAFLMYEDIDASKKADLAAKRLAERDPLTGVLNRKTFSDAVDALISRSAPNMRHAFLMLDVDGFKLLNDTLGHATGDEALIEIAQKLQSILRYDDILGRLGGDEFVLLLNDIVSEENIIRKAGYICEAVRKAYSVEVSISASIGISVYPRDGGDCKTLYEKADAAMYAAKGRGKNTYAFYGDNQLEADTSEQQAAEGVEGVVASSKHRRRMLIVDDSSVDREVLANIFKGEFIIEKAYDGQTALMRMRHYGASISVVLLDLFMAGMNGFEVLDKMQSSQEMRGVPVIVVSSDRERQTSLNAIRRGASDFVSKPVDPEVIRLRVASAISRSENERLRVQSSYLQLRNEETSRYQVALETLGMFVIELDWIKGTFSYDPKIAEYLKGTYDERGLWRILLSDMVADAMEVKRMQEFLHRLAENRMETEGSMAVQMRAPNGAKHWFRVCVKKIANEYALTEKLVAVFCDVGTEEPKSEATF